MLEAGESLRVASDIVGKKFERDETVKTSVFGLVHNSHSAATELLEDEVVRNGLADHRWVTALGDAC